MKAALAVACLCASFLSNANQLENHEVRLDILERDFIGLTNDVNRLDGMIAANAASAAMLLPPNYSGGLAFQFGTATYNTEGAAALGIVTGSDEYIMRTTISGSSGDNWEKLVYAFSLTISTSVFD